MKKETLADKFHRQRRTFWLAYFGSIISLLLISFGITISIISWQELLKELASSQARDWLLFAFILFCFSIPFWLFYGFMCMAQRECMVYDARMSDKERLEVSRIYDGEIRFGNICFMENYFVFLDSRRFFMRNILPYDEIIWVYITRLDFQYTNMEKMIISPQMKFFSLVLMTRDGKKHSIFLGPVWFGENWAKLLKRLPDNVISGYGRQQKQQAKQQQRWYAEYYDSSIPEKRKRERRRNIWMALGAACVCSLWVGVYLFLESDYYDYLRKLRRADAAYGREDYLDAYYYYKWAGELNPASARAEEGRFWAFLGSTRGCVEDGLLENTIGSYQVILDWHPEMGELYIEASEAALQCGNPMAAVAFLDRGITAWEEGKMVSSNGENSSREVETKEALAEKREYVLTHIRVESHAGYRNGSKIREEFFDEGGNLSKRISYGAREKESYRTEYVYDETGRCVEEYTYDEGEPAGQTFYVYDTAGNLTEKTWYYEEGVLGMRFIFQYDEAGNEILYRQSREDVIYKWYEQEYDEAGRIIRYVEKQEDGSIMNRTEYTYDKDGREVERRCYNQEGELFWQILTAYEKDGLEGTVEEQVFNHVPEQAQTRCKIWYDVAGNMKKYVDYDTDGAELSKKLVEYDEEGREIKYREWLKEECIHDREYVYDEEGRVVTINRYSDKESGRRLDSQTSYTYDAAGNRIKETKVEYSSEGEEKKAVNREEYRYVYEG
ncbi:MAG: hypothetical protein NC081_00475 [Roseburia sp.]|nr:hypothetical protein [Roseburia sp.]